MSEAKRLKLEGTTKVTLTPVLADDFEEALPLVEVYLGTIKDPKTISKVVVDLNSVVPIPELIHLKRVKGREILLFPKNIVVENGVLSYLVDKGFDTSLIETTLRVAKVAKVPPKVRKQYDVVHKLWPCNFHSNHYLEKLSTNTLFSENDLQEHAQFMRITIDICEVAGVTDSTVIVDSTIGSLVGFGFDQRDYYPIKHSVMLAIDDVARSQKGGVWEPHKDYTKIETFLKSKYNLKFGFSTSDEGPYLCTGYSVYCIMEPCITCAMALIHSRAKRVFYGVKNEKGALGTLCKIHTVQNLNHHYEAFSGLLEDQCREVLTI